MNDKVKKEVVSIIDALHLDCSIDDFREKADWFQISNTLTISVPFIREFQDKVVFNCLYITQFSVDFLREFRHKINWTDVSMRYPLTEDLIREFQNYVNWGVISACQILSERFIEEFKDRVYWGDVLEFQDVSAQFVERMKDKVDFARKYKP